MASQYNPIQILPGVQPDTDYTKSATKHYTYADKIRFYNGVARKIGGWNDVTFTFGDTPEGIIRSIYSTIINGKYYQLLGTAADLYSVIGSTLTNITPLQTTSVPIANSLNTAYFLLGNDPFSTESGSNVVTITVSNADAYRPNDEITITGASTTNGIPAIELNTTHVVRTVTSTTITVRTVSNATSTGVGGGALVNFASGLIQVDATAHGQAVGDRVKIDDAATTGGIVDTDINQEFIIRKIATDDFWVMTDGTATSSVTAGGGASTIYFKQIVPGNVNETNVIGYGAGLYGAGLYGTGRESSTSRSLPRIWFSDKFGETVITTPGNQGGLYQWLADNDTAPELITNAPTAINYAFVSDGIIVTFGAGGTENRIFACDQNNPTEWSSSSVNQVYDDDIEGAGRLLSHCPVESYNLIFTENQTYTFRYIGLPFVWEINALDESIGIIAPMARTSVNGIAFWMGLENFYMFRGGAVEVIPSNSGAQSTCLKYVFNNLNWGQKSKCFAWYNRDYNEVWFHYPSEQSNECDRVVAVNILDFTWSIHTLDRSAAEYPNVILKKPYLANANDVYQHELGWDAGTSPLAFTLSTNWRDFGRNNAKLQSVIPDSMQTGTIQLQVNGYRFPQSSDAIMTQGPFNITSTTERVPVAGAARYIEYTISGSELGQEFMIGNWVEEVQKGPSF